MEVAFFTACMQFKIPFTNIQISTNEAEKKSTIFAKSGFSFNPSRDRTGMRLNPASLFATYRFNADIYGCVREWRENVGINGLQYIDPLDIERPIENKVVQILDSFFSSYTSFRPLKSRIVKDLGIAGNAFLEVLKNINGDRVGLAPIDPRTISIVSDKHGKVYRYIQGLYGNNPVEFLPEDIIHIKLDVDPDNEVFGFSPIEPVIWEAKTDLAAAMSNYYFFENDAQPSVQYILDEGLSEDESKALIDSIKENFGGPDKRHKVGALQGVKDIKTISVSQKDMEFLQGRRYTTEKICAAYGVPKFLLGYTESVNNNNGTELLKKFFQSTIQPLEELITDVLNRELLKILGLEGKVKMLFKPMLFDEQAEVEKRALEEKKHGAITLRQYKIKTGQKITPEDEKTPNFDGYIIENGASAVLLEDVGVDPVVDSNNPEQINKLIETIEKNFMSKP